MASKYTILSSDQPRPRPALFSCSLKVNIYFSFLLLLIFASYFQADKNFRFRPSVWEDDSTVWLVNMRGIFNGLHHQELGASLDPL